MTERALESIKNNSQYPYRLIVIDNNSDPETVWLLEDACRTGRFGEMILVRNTQNVGWVKGTNQGLAISDSDYVCLVNTDILAGPGWLRNMVSAMERMADVGVADPEGDKHRQKREVPDVDTYAREVAERRRGTFTEVECCSGFCMLIRRSLINELGLLDEVYEGGYGADTDYCRRAWKAGYRCIRCHDAFVFHFGSRSFSKIPEVRKKLMERNADIYQRRWGKSRRILVLARYSAAEDLLQMARAGSIVYVIRNRYANPRMLPCSHVNLRFRGVGLPLFGNTLEFLAKAYYLGCTGRIDAAVIAFNRTSLEGTGTPSATRTE
jgi:GT2 family glycosyltransferase